MTTTSSSSAAAIATAITSCQPLDHKHVEAIIELLPSVGSFSITLPVLLPRQESYVLQTCFNLEVQQQPCAGRSAVFSVHEQLLARTVCATGKALLCPSSKLEEFADVKNLVKDASCAAVHVACLPLIGPSMVLSPPLLEKPGAPTQPRNRPFGSFCIAFRNGVIDKQTVAAAHSLCRALSSEHGDALQAHAETIISCLNTPMHSNPADDLDEEDDETVSNLMNEDITDEASCSRAAVTPTDQTSQSETNPSSCQNALMMTFHNPLLESGYLQWSAQHMRRLDPAATVFVCTFYCALGFAPNCAMAFNHIFPWAAGWISLLPILLCMLPGINHIYVAYREQWLLLFHVLSILWHVCTANTTKYLGPSGYLQVSNNPAACFAWQFLNLVMFQVRWKYVLGIASAMLVFNTIPLAPELCTLFEEHRHVGVGDSECAHATIFYGAALVLAAVVVLRVNECRMRRLFLNTLDQKQKKR